ncbi:MAG TPA: hypothetical protein PKD92_00755 [Novosphingobium sp.]|nr:hypothetical protein [Novosphingobium sp.]HMP55088.1 hypothetical protein [Novosphingobium sp.]
MGLLDGILGAAGQKAAIGAIAQKVGIPPALAESAIGALVQNHARPGNTVAGAAQESGLQADVLGKIVEQLGGTGGLGALVGAVTGSGGFVADPDKPDAAAPAGGLDSILAGLGGASGLAKMLDRDGDGNPLNDIAGMLGRK